MSEIIAFPISRNARFVRRQAQRMGELRLHVAENWLRYVLISHFHYLESIGVNNDLIISHVYDLEIAIRHELSSIKEAKAVVY